MFIRKMLAIMIFSSVCLSLVGCETVKGASDGFAKDVKNTSDNIPDVWQKVKEADEWFQENAW